MSRKGQPRERTYENIKNFWESKAAEQGESPQVTIRDHFFRNHELQTLLSMIPRCKRLLDAGCGTGFGSLVLSQRADYTLGVDYSKNMIQWAVRARDDRLCRVQQARKLKIFYDMEIRGDRQVDFVVGDVLDLDLDINNFDVVTGQRILINLTTYQQQMRALENLSKHSSGSAWLFLTEATIQGHKRTDEYRQRFGLPILEKHWNNNYVDESRYGEWVDHGWRVVATHSFETYMLLSKVIYPAAVGPENCAFLSGANEAACEIANIFRTQTAAQEVGIASMLQMYVERVERYNQFEGKALRRWIEKYSKSLPNWENLGHQQVIVAKASEVKHG